MTNTNTDTNIDTNINKERPSTLIYMIPFGIKIFSAVTGFEILENLLNIRSNCFLDGIDIFIIICLNLIMLLLLLGFIYFISIKNCFGKRPIYDYRYINLIFPILSLINIIFVLINIIENSSQCITLISLMYVLEFISCS